MKQKIKHVVLTFFIVLLGALALAHIGIQRASAEPMSTEVAGEMAACDTLDAVPTIAGVSGVIAGLVRHGWDATAAGATLYNAVTIRCPEHYALAKEWSKRY